jgi:phosphomannomutase
MTNFDFSIFKSYDIRGVYPEQINKEIAYDIGRAYLDYIREIEKVDEPKIVVGRDARESSDELFEAFVRGITDQGGDVFDIGLATTPMLYWAVNFFKAQGGAMITASHNPGEYNGIKMTRSKGIPIGEGTGMETIKGMVKKKAFKRGETKESINKKPVTPYYLDFLTKDVKVDLGGKIVVDAGNAMTGLLLPDLLNRLNVDYVPLYFDIDCTFPNHEANPFKEETLIKIKETIKKEKAILGVAFDGDGDRAAFIDENGKTIRGDFITALLAKKILSKKKGKILYDLRSLWTPREEIEKSGGEAIVSRVGHSLIKAQMRKEKAIFAGEMSGHYFFEDFFGCESALLTMIKIFEILSEEKKSIKKLAEPFKKYYHSGEINFEVKNKVEMMGIIDKHYKTGKHSRLDGVTVEFKSWWFNVRSSNTESILRLNLEVKEKKELTKKIDEINRLIIDNGGKII